MKKIIKLKIFDLRLDKNQGDMILTLVLRDKESEREILLPISDYEFRYIKNLVLKKDPSSYVSSLNKTFEVKKTELIIQDDQVKVKLSLITDENFIHEIILPPIEALLYCADRGMDIVVDEKIFQQVQILGYHLQKINIDEKNIGDDVEDQKNLKTTKNDIDLEIKDIKYASTAIDDSNLCDNLSLLQFNKIDNSLDLKTAEIAIKNQQKTLNINLSKEEIKIFTDNELVNIFKCCLAEYCYESASIIQDEMKERNIDVWHELCTEDFL